VPSPDKLLPLESYTPLPADAPLASTLAVELQYGKTYGAPNLVAWLKEHVQRVHSPPTTGWELLVTAGNTDGSDGILRSMLDKGDSVLVEEFAYPGLLCAAASQGKPCVGVTMDQEGILPQALEEVMAGWDEEARGSRKPKLLLMVTYVEQERAVAQFQFRVVLTTDQDLLQPYRLHHPRDPQARAVRRVPQVEPDHRGGRPL
jgi:aromatic amino acid aminotransferase I